MGELILIAIVIANHLFALTCGWMEGAIDHIFWSTEVIAGRRKHRTYMVLRGPFWSLACILISRQWNGTELVYVLLTMVGVMLAEFPYLQTGEYHKTRNKLNPVVSPNGFKQDDDGLSGSVLDHVLGRTYHSRLAWYLLSWVAFIACLIVLALGGI